MARGYVPKAGEVVWLEFDPQAGHEQVDGVACSVLSDQLKSLDWKVRRAKKKARVTDEVMLHVRAKMKALLQIS